MKKKTIIEVTRKELLEDFQKSVITSLKYSKLMLDMFGDEVTYENYFPFFSLIHLGKDTNNKQIIANSLSRYIVAYQEIADDKSALKEIRETLQILIETIDSLKVEKAEEEEK